MKGMIYKSLSGFYYIKSKGRDYVCRGAGKLRLEQSPMVGDLVEFSMEHDPGVVEKIYPRKNALTRPSVANVDRIAIVLSVSPKPDYLLCDKLLIQAATAQVEPILFANKMDLTDEEDILEPYYATGYRLIRGSAVMKHGLDELMQALDGGINCMAGQSGVGKSSILNSMLPGLELSTGRISKKTSRGTHTTRHVELILLPDGGYIADTPGFSALNMELLEPATLARMYPEWQKEAAQCKYTDCLHIAGSQGCAVKKALQEGRIHPTRYDNYVMIIDEIMERRRKQYD
ncbi:MAG: ribosome small subunit-dependent GTPase A [Christensenellales bacterium]|jgi:ribosome biogenesis GTPase